MENEKRLIDANALRKRMFSYYSCVDENSSKEYYKGETLMNYEVADMIEDCIDNAPTVDAVEVVHGQWIYEDDTVMKWTTKAICSACNCVVAQSVELAHEYGRENHKKRNNYCPNCGAKMDGGNEDG